MLSDLLVLGFLAALLGLRFEEGGEVLGREGVVVESLSLPFPEEPDEGAVDEQGSDLVLEGTLVSIGEVDSKDFDEFYLAFCVEFVHEGHD